MTIDKALYQYFSGFGLSAYPASAIPDGVTLPYLSYSREISYLNGGETACQVQLFFKTESEATPNAKVAQIEASVKALRPIAIDDGYIWIKRGSPFVQNITVQDDITIKGRLINLTLEYLRP